MIYYGLYVDIESVISPCTVIEGNNLFYQKSLKYGSPVVDSERRFPHGVSEPLTAYSGRQPAAMLSVYRQLTSVTCL